jgi:ferredoxin
MSLTAYFLLAKRSRREVKVLSVFSLLYFGFYRLGCVCAVGSVQNVALAFGPNGYALPFAVGAYFLLPILFALFFGRVFCGAACPLGAVQDLLAIRPRKVPKALDSALTVLPYVWLGLGVFFAWQGAAFVICEYDPFVGFFRLSMRSGAFWLSIAFVLLSLFVGRPYCRFLCPYGALLRLFSPLAKWKVQITPSECIKCHLCADACPFGSIVPPTPENDDIDRAVARKQLGWAILSVPILVVIFGGIGYLAAPSLAQEHRVVDQARQVWLVEQGKGDPQADAVRAWKSTGKPDGELYYEALQVRNRFRNDAPIFGAFLGLVIGMKLVGLSRRRKRTQYEADSADCVSCGRCYDSCPVEQARVNPEMIVRLEEIKKQMGVARE